MKCRIYRRIILKILITTLLLLTLSEHFAYGTDEIISTQMETLNMSSFIKEGEKYTQDVFPDLDGKELLSSAISGKIDNSGIFKGILSLLRERSCDRNNFNW